MVYRAFRLHGKLDIVAIGPLQETDALDLAEGEGCDLPGPNQPHGPNARVHP